MSLSLKKAKEILNGLVEAEKANYDKLGVEFSTDRFASLASEIGLTSFQLEQLWRMYAETTSQSVGELRASAMDAIAIARGEAEAEGAELARREAIEDSKMYGDELSKQDAQIMLNKILNNREHAYWAGLTNNSATIAEAQEARALVDRLYQIVAGQANSLDGYLEELELEREEATRGQYGYNPKAERSSASGKRVKHPEDVTGIGEGGIDQLRPHPKSIPCNTQGHIDNDGEYHEDADEE